NNTATVTVADYSVTLNLLGIDNSQQLTVKVNNVSHPFTYDAGTHILTISGITLINGQNSIQVNATNACSNETINYSVQYNGCQPPVITLGTNASTATAELYNFAASVTNITNSSEIQV